MRHSGIASLVMRRAHGPRAAALVAAARSRDAYAAIRQCFELCAPGEPAQRLLLQFACLRGADAERGGGLAGGARFVSGESEAQLDDGAFARRQA